MSDVTITILPTREFSLKAALLAGGLVMGSVVIGSVMTSAPFVNGFADGVQKAADEHFRVDRRRPQTGEVARSFAHGIVRGIGAGIGSMLTKHLLVPIVELRAPSLRVIALDTPATVHADGTALGSDPEPTIYRVDAEDLVKLHAVNDFLGWIGVGSREFTTTLRIEQCEQGCAYGTEALRVSPDGRISGALVGERSRRPGYAEGSFEAGKLHLMLTLPYRTETGDNVVQVTRPAVIGPNAGSASTALQGILAR